MRWVFFLNKIFLRGKKWGCSHGVCVFIKILSWAGEKYLVLENLSSSREIPSHYAIYLKNLALSEECTRSQNQLNIVIHSQAPLGVKCHVVKIGPLELFGAKQYSHKFKDVKHKNANVVKILKRVGTYPVSRTDIFKEPEID